MKTLLSLAEGAVVAAVLESAATLNEKCGTAMFAVSIEVY